MPMPIRSSLFSNDRPRLRVDCQMLLGLITPHAPTEQCRQNCGGSDNADGDLKRQVMGQQVVLAVAEERLDIGSWGCFMASSTAGDASACLS